MGQLIKNSDAHPETSTIDGSVTTEDLTQTKTWHDCVTGNADMDDGFEDLDWSFVAVMIWGSLNATNKWRRCGRSILLFDTSELPDVCTITSATLQVYGNSKNDGLPCTPNICIYSSNPAANNALQASDHVTFGNTELSNIIAYGDWVVDAWNTFTLNAAGRALISKTGVTKLGFRNANYDVADELDPNNHDPQWKSNSDSYLSIRSADRVGFEPIFTVNYTTDLPAGQGSGQGIFTARKYIWSGGN